MFEKSMKKMKDVQSKNNKEVKDTTSSKSIEVNSPLLLKAMQEKYITNDNQSTVVIDVTNEIENNIDTKILNKINDIRKNILSKGAKEEMMTILEPVDVMAVVQRKIACIKIKNLVFSVIASKDNITCSIWNIDKTIFPTINNKMPSEKFGTILRTLIQKRLGMDGIVINPIMPNKNNRKKYKTFKNNVIAFNMFENGYIRGSYKGVSFVWNVFKYKAARRITTLGYGGKMLGSDMEITNEIKELLKLNGITTKNTYKQFLDSNKQFAVSKTEKCFNKEEISLIKTAKELNSILSKNNKLDKNNSDHIKKYKVLVNHGYVYNKELNKFTSEMLAKKWRNYNEQFKKAA